MPRRPASRQSESFVSRRRKRLMSTIVLVIISVAIWVFALSRLSMLPMLEIDSVAISGADPDIIPTLHAAAQKTLEGSYLGIFSKSNAFMYPRSAIRKAVAASSPRVQTVQVHMDGLHAVVVSVNEKTPAAIICPGLPDFENNNLAAVLPGSCYFADQNGFIFTQADSISTSTYALYYTPDLGDSAAVASTSQSTGGLIGQYATSTAEFAALQAFYQAAREGGLSPEAILIKDSGEYELYIKDSTLVYFNNSRPFEEELSNLLSFWNKKSQEARASKKPLQFDYIDVRYGSNVFYPNSK